jgi:hypothetical protein
MNLVFSTRLARIGMAGLVLVGAAIAAPQVASAGSITFSAPTVDLPTSGSDRTGFIDIAITDTTSDPLAQFLADVFINPGATNITFISADFSTTIPYVIQPTTNSGDISGSGSVFFDSNEATNNDGTNTGVTTIGTSPLGLLRIEYDVPGGTPAGTYPITFNQDDPNTSGDPFASFVDTVSNEDITHLQSPNAFVNGAIVITPEPSSVLLAVLGAVGLIGVGLRRVRRA